MANWAAYKEKEIGLPVVKRAKHGIHFDAGKGLVQAEFVGKPCHYFDGKEYKAIDTTPLLRKDGTYGCAHSDVIIHTDGTVQVGDYTQRAALIYPGKISVDGDRIARPFSGGVQYLYITETGFRQEIVLEKMPDLRKVSALVDSVKGVLPTKYTASSLSLKDSSTAELSDFVQVDSKSLASVLEAAKYPVVIDPDFVAGTGDGLVWGNNATYTIARSTSAAESTTGNNQRVGQRWTGTVFNCFRLYFPFDTSSIGAGSTVTQANLKLTWQSDYSDTDFDIEIIKYSYGGSREARYDAFLTDTIDQTLASSTDYSANGQVTSPNLDITFINKEGITYYGLMSDRDIAATEPSGNEYVYFWMANYTTESYRPVLTVTYTAGGVPKHYLHYARLRG